MWRPEGANVNTPVNWDDDAGTGGSWIIEARHLPKHKHTVPKHGHGLNGGVTNLGSTSKTSSKNNGATSSAGSHSHGLGNGLTQVSGFKGGTTGTTARIRLSNVSTGTRLASTIEYSSNTGASGAALTGTDSQGAHTHTLNDHTHTIDIAHGHGNTFAVVDKDAFDTNENSTTNDNFTPAFRRCYC